MTWQYAVHYIKLECSVVHCSEVQCSEVQCSAVQYSAVQCSAMQCNVYQSSLVQFIPVPCSVVQSSGIGGITCTCCNVFSESAHMTNSASKLQCLSVVCCVCHFLPFKNVEIQIFQLQEDFLRKTKEITSNSDLWILAQKWSKNCRADKVNFWFFTTNYWWI